MSGGAAATYASAVSTACKLCGCENWLASWDVAAAKTAPRNRKRTCTKRNTVKFSPRHARRATKWPKLREEISPVLRKGLISAIAISCASVLRVSNECLPLVFVGAGLSPRKSGPLKIAGLPDSHSQIFSGTSEGGRGRLRRPESEKTSESSRQVVTPRTEGAGARPRAPAHWSTAPVNCGAADTWSRVFCA